MNRILTTVFGVCISLAFLMAGSICRADMIIELNEAQWNRVGSPPQLVFSVLADNNTTYGADSNSMNSFNLFFRIRPTSGTIGSLAIHAVAPSSNRIFETYSDISFNPDIGGGIASILGQNIIPPIPNSQPSNVTLAPGARRNLVALNITPSADARGQFELFVSSISNYAFVDQFDGVAFRNLPFSDPPTELRLGSFSVITAVPEPSAATLTILLLTAIALVRRRDANPVV